MLDAAEKARVVFELIVEPVVFGREADQQSSGFSVTGDNDLLALSFAQGAGRTKLTLDWFERQLGVAGTQRNWNTLLKLVELTARAAGD